MKFAKVLGLSLVSALLTLPMLGCGGEGSTPDAGKSTAPAVTKENAADLTKSVNAGAGDLGKGAPGINK